MKVPGTDHVQLAMSKGSEDRVRGFYSKVLGMKETTKPQALAGRRGCWFASGAAQVHLGVAYSALVGEALDEILAKCQAALSAH